VVVVLQECAPAAQPRPITSLFINEKISLTWPADSRSADSRMQSARGPAVHQTGDTPHAANPAAGNYTGLASSLTT